MAGSIDPETGKTVVEPGDPGPKSDIHGDQGVYTNARSAEGGENAPQPIIDPDDPYNRKSGAGKGDKGRTLVSAGTTSEKTTPKQLTKDVTIPPTDETDTGDGIPAGMTRTTTADDDIDASDSVAAGVSHPVETRDFARLQQAQVPARYMRETRKSSKSGFTTSITGTPTIGSTISAKIDGVTLYDKVWLRIDGPDQSHRVRCAHEGDTASQAVMITRPGKYVIGFEVNTDVVGETEFVVE